MKTSSWLTRGVLVAALGLATMNCGGGGGSADKLDPASLEEGASHTLKLKYWMKGSGYIGDERVENLHFDDAANERVVFYIGDGVKPKVGALEQNKVYSVTFTHSGGDPLIRGTATAIE